MSSSVAQSSSNSLQRTLASIFGENVDSPRPDTRWNQQAMMIAPKQQAIMVAPETSTDSAKPTGVHSKVSVSCEQILDFEKITMELRQCQDEQRLWLRAFIQQEFQDNQEELRDFIHQELQLFTSEVKASKEDMHASVETRSSKMDVAARPSAVNTNAVHQPQLQRSSTLFKISDDHGGDAKKWLEFVSDVESFDATCAYKRVLDSILKQRSVWHDLFQHNGLLHLLSTKRPQNCAAIAVGHPMFSIGQALLILVNTGIMIYETEVELSAELQQPRGEVPAWLETCNQAFNIIFAVEIVFRIVAERTWFLVDPNEWGWNIFDVVLVILCSPQIDTNVSYLRTMRVIRVFRVARILRVMRFFRQLRKMLYSIMACLVSLAWAFVFLAATMTMFSLVCMQGAMQILQDHDISGGESVMLDNGRHSLRHEVEHRFGSFLGSMFSLIGAVSGGIDWVDVQEPLTYAGATYSILFILYVLFVSIGVMNVLTGVFLTNASEFVDVDLIVQTEQVKVEQFCAQLIGIFLDMDAECLGKVDWPTFQKALTRADTQAYLGSMDLETTHIRLVFDLLDKDQSGEIEIEQFVMGLVKLKGASKAIDARIIQRELGMLPFLIKQLIAGFTVNGARSDASTHSLASD